LQGNDLRAPKDIVRSLEISCGVSQQIGSLEMSGDPKKLEYRWDPTRGLVVTISHEFREPSTSL
jgi:hypothetical protein